MASISKLKQIPKQKSLLLISVIAFAVIGSILLFVSNASPTTSINISTTSSSVPINNEIVFDVNVSTGGETVNGATAVITYNTANLEFVAFDKSATNFEISAEESAQSGRIVYSAGTKGSGSTLATLNLVKLRFKAIGAGSTTLTVDKASSTVASGVTNTNVIGTVQNSTITVSNPNPPADTTPPASPSGLKVTGQGDRQVSVAWNANAEADFRDYQVRYRLASATTSSYTIATNSTTQTNITISNLTNDVDYIVEVRATDTSNNSSNYSAITTKALTPADTTPPAKPAGLKVDSVTNRQVKVSWTANTENDLAVYTLRYRPAGSTGAYTTVANLTTNTYTISNLVNGTAYAIEVAAVDKTGNTSAFSAIQATPIDNINPTVSITAPSNNADAIGTTGITTSVSDNEAIAKVDMLIDGVLSESKNTIPYNFAWDSTKVSNGQHTITVRAFDSSNNQATATVTVNVKNTVVEPPDTTAPTTPSGVSAKLANGVIIVGWSASTDNKQLAGYRVQKYVNNSLVSTFNVNSSTLSLSDGAVSAGNSYQYSVASVDAAGNVSMYSVRVSVDYPVPPDTTAPSTPSNLTSTLNGSSVSLSWSPSSDASGIKNYVIYKNGRAIATSTQTNFSDSSLLVNVDYRYRVQAVDNNNNPSSLSNEVLVKIQPAPDTTAPSTPGGLSATAQSSSQINLSWAASQDNVGVVGYKVYRNGQELSTTTGTTLADGSLAPSTTYTYQVASFDAAGNTSLLSDPVSTTTSPSAEEITSVLVLGRVTDRDTGVGINRVNVVYFQGKAKKTTRSTSTGNYYAKGVPVSVNSLTYDNKSYVEQTKPVNLGVNKIETINVEMARR
jgi:fibronectin type 3 domain-containing protein